jgi:hypothetical protein
MPTPTPIQLQRMLRTCEKLLSRNPSDSQRESILAVHTRLEELYEKYKAIEKELVSLVKVMITLVLCSRTATKPTNSILIASTKLWLIWKE